MNKVIAKQEEPTIVTQYCLDIQPVDRLVKDLPRGVRVKAMSWRGYSRKARRKLVIPAYLTRLGLQHSYTCDSDTDLAGKFRGINNAGCVKAITRIAKSYKLSLDRMTVRWVTLTDGRNEIQFKRMYKQIKLPNDKRRKKLVLGMVRVVKGKSVELLSKLSAKKITCKLMKAEKTIVMCTEEVVV